MSAIQNPIERDVALIQAVDIPSGIFARSAELLKIQKLTDVKHEQKKGRLKS